MPIVTRTATLPLDVLVVGGGIGGMAAAYILSKVGHRVRVVERYALDAPGGGMRVPPNLSKILRQWVGEEELRKVTTRCIGSPFHRLETGELVGYFHWKPVVMAEMGGEFLMILREDLIRMLHKLATDAGATVYFNTEVVAVHQGSDESPNPSVTLANGDVLTADLLIGADGSGSKLRDVVLDEDDFAKPVGLTAYTGVVKAEELRDDPIFGPYLAGDEWPIWMGNCTGSHVHPVHGRTGLFFALNVWEGSKHYEELGDESWSELCPATQLPTENMCPLLKRLVKMTPRVIRTKFMTRPHGIDDWIDSTGRIILLGNAAHPTIPGGTHTASLAVEDAVVLGSLLSHLRTLEQLPAFINAYEELRKQRCQAIVFADHMNSKVLALPPGPETEARDANLRPTVDDMDEGNLKAQFEEIAQIFLYDAGDEAEEWWINWGRFYDRTREREQDPEEPPNVMGLSVPFSSFSVSETSE